MEDPNRRRETPNERIVRLEKDYGAFLLRIALRLGASPDEDDAVQTALLQGLKFLRGGNKVGSSPSAERAWLYVLVRNATHDIHRKRQSGYKQRKTRDEGGQLTTEYKPEQVKNRKVLWQRVNALDPKYRGVIEACVVEDQPVAQWAQQVGIHRKKAERLRDKGLRILREQLESDDDFL